MVVKFFANFLQITRRMTGVWFPAHRFCPTENASPLKRSPESGPRKILPMSNRTRRSIGPFTDWLLPETFDGSLVASTPPRGKPDHGQGHSPQPMRHDRRADPRRQSSVVLYRLTAATGLGLTDAVPNRRTHRWPHAADHLRNLTLDFQGAAQSRLGWAGHPPMRFPQALHSLRDMLVLAS
jgi:hypothetical protein